MNHFFYRDAEEAANSIYQIAGELQGKTILVTGATGMLGIQTVNVLLYLKKEKQMDIKIIALVRNKTKFVSLFSEVDRKEIVTVTHDFSDSNKIPDIEADYIIHTVAVTGGSKQHVDKPVTTIYTALSSMYQILEMAKSTKVKGMVFLSSLEVYGKTDKEKLSISEQDYGYIDPVNVRSSYSESKRMCETMCVSYAKQFHIPIFIARLTATFGVGTRFDDNRVFAQFARSIVKNEDIVLKSTGETVRNYCYVNDAVAAIFYILLQGKSGEAYNVANMDTAISIKEMAERIIEQNPYAKTKLIFDLEDDIQKLGYNENIIKRLDTKKLENLGWKPQIDMNTMLRRLVEYMRFLYNEESK